MEPYTNEQQAIIEKAIWRFIRENKDELSRILGSGDGGSKIVGLGCIGSAVQPTVECSPSGSPCEIHVTAGKTGKVLFKRSA